MAIEAIIPLGRSPITGCRGTEASRRAGCPRNAASQFRPKGRNRTAQIKDLRRATLGPVGTCAKRKANRRSQPKRGTGTAVPGTTIEVAGMIPLLGSGAKPQVILPACNQKAPAMRRGFSFCFLRMSSCISAFPCEWGRVAFACGVCGAPWPPGARPDRARLRRIPGIE